MYGLRQTHGLLLILNGTLYWQNAPHLSYVYRYVTILSSSLSSLLEPRAMSQPDDGDISWWYCTLV